MKKMKKDEKLVKKHKIYKKHKKTWKSHQKKVIKTCHKKGLKNTPAKRY